MPEDISRLNDMYFNEWKKINPNLKNIIFSNNVIISTNGKLPLGSLILSDLLYNSSFKNEIYTMTEEKFIKILRIHRKAKSVLGDIVEFKDEQYIKHIYADASNNAVVVSNDLSEIPLNSNINNVLSIYNTLLEIYNNYVPVSAIIREFDKNKVYSSSVYNVKFFYLINSNSKLSDKHKDYIYKISNFIYELFSYQDYLVGDAKELLAKYIFNLENINLIGNKTETQKYALTLYQQISKNYLNTIANIYQQETEKEAHRASLGYSSIVLIVTSVLITGILIAMVILK